MTVFYLVRHAHATWTRDEMRPLSVIGARAAERLAERMSDFPITHIVSSKSLRAQQTVAPLAGLLELNVILEPDLRERQLISTDLSIEPLGSKAAFRDAVHATWQNPHFAHPGGETNAAAQSRGVGVLQKLRHTHTGGHIVLGTHGNLLTLILQHFEPSIGFDFWTALTMPDVVSLAIDDQGNARIRHLGKLDIATHSGTTIHREGE